MPESGSQNEKETDPWLGPVFLRETLALARRRRYFTLRATYGLILLYAMYFALSSYGPIDALQVPVRTLSRVGQTLFQTVAVTQYVVVAIVVPMLVCGVIAGERTAGTLDLLFLTHLSNREIVLGKLMSRSAIALVVVASGMPAISFTLMFGGIDPWQLIHAEIAAILNVFFCGAVAIYFSTTQPTNTKALGYTYALLALMSILGVTWVLTPNAYFAVATFVPFETVHPALGFIGVIIPSVMISKLLSLSILRLRVQPTLAVSQLSSSSEVMERELYRRLATGRLNSLAKPRTSGESPVVEDLAVTKEHEKRSLDSMTDAQHRQRRMEERRLVAMEPISLVNASLKEISAAMLVILIAPFGGFLFLGAIAVLIVVLVEGWLIILSVGFLTSAVWVTFCAATNSMVDATKQFRDVLFTTPLSGNEILTLLRQRVVGQSRTVATILFLISAMFGLFLPVAAVICLVTTLLLAMLGYIIGTACVLKAASRNEAILCSVSLLLLIAALPLMTEVGMSLPFSLMVFFVSAISLAVILIRQRNRPSTAGICVIAFLVFLTVNALVHTVSVSMNSQLDERMPMSLNPIFTLVLDRSTRDIARLHWRHWEPMIGYITGLAACNLLLAHLLRRNFDSWSNRPTIPT